ncbi:hypothetical protein ACFVT5_36955 [Streptomyces sp. NPDC058001]|uniref:hypothetical protein n=1 Tax=Streptomyces sp. NPDC058001 TaxID=3346300 RepID=UPI0036EF07B1
MSSDSPWAPEPRTPEPSGLPDAARAASGFAEATTPSADETQGREGAPPPPPSPHPAPSPLQIERVPTGNADVDAQLGRLGDADHLATDGHIEVYEDVHRGLRDTLTALDSRPGPPAPGPPAPGPQRAPSPSYDHRS